MLSRLILLVLLRLLQIKLSRLTYSLLSRSRPMLKRLRLKMKTFPGNMPLTPVRFHNVSESMVPLSKSSPLSSSLWIWTIIWSKNF
jgi:hypothetical protein